MADKSDKYNDNKARYLAALAVQNMHNKNLGVPYIQVIENNRMIKNNIDVETIMIATEMSKEEIEKIEQNAITYMMLKNVQ